MPRVRRGFKARRRHNRILKLAKGYRGAHGRLFRSAVEAVERALCYAYRDRKQRKRSFRRLWIVRINAAARLNGVTYSKLMHQFKEAGIDLDRRVLADIAANDPTVFTSLVEASR